MRIGICPYCKEPFETELMEGSDGICERCYRKEMREIRGGFIKRLWRAVKRIANQIRNTLS